MYLIAKDYKAGRLFLGRLGLEGGSRQDEALSTSGEAYAVRRRLGLGRTTILSEAGSEIAVLSVERCPECVMTRIK
jgi:hypothetical protein